MGDVLPIVEKVFEYVVHPGYKQVAYILDYKQNVDELNRSVEDLRRDKERLEHQVDEADKNLRKIEAKVTEWLREVGEFKSKFEDYMKDEGHTKSRFPYLWNRHRLSRRATKMAMEVKKLRDETPKSDEVAYTENVTSNDVTSSNVGYMDFGSRKSLMNEILASLQDSTVRMIGLHGPSGVGKSTFVKEIVNIARNKKIFNVTAIAEITANPNLQKIQEEIAYSLGLRLEGVGENVRADCIRRRLKKEKDNTLIILDDIWDKLDLNKLGIPLDDDDNDYDYDLSKRNETKGKKNENEMNPSCKVMKTQKSLGDYKRCKILLTSRVEKILSDKMDVKSIFRIKELDDKDALILFQKTVGISNEMSNFKQEIVKKYCEGIPMAIITVGRALRDKSDSVWEARLEKLKKQELVGVQKPMEISLKMSYDHLESEELKSIFLLCAQMGHQPLTMDLVKYSFGLGILEGVYSLMEARDRIDTSIEKLKGSCLVLDGSSSNCFNMHDMVRDAALSIAHKEKNIFTMRNGKLDDWPELETCTSISICNSDILDKLPRVINCHQLIDNDDSSLRIPNGIFKGMKKLKVLILNGFFHLSNLEKLIKGLSNLRMLCLERCNLDGNLSIIGKLKKLRILNFSGSQIENFPEELWCLDKLQSLDTSNCCIQRMCLPNSISRLTSLEELYIRKCLINSLVVKETNVQIALLSKLKDLHQLKVVDLSLPNVAVFPKDLFFDNLNDYKFVIGDIKVFSDGDFRMPNKYEPYRSLALQLKEDTNNIHSQNGIKLLFKTVQNLLLGEINSVKNVIYELNLDGFPDLKHLSITNNFSIKHIFDPKDLAHPLDVFPNLESLCLYKLRNIEMICCGPVTDVSFTKLKTIKINMCAHLKNVISIYMIKLLSNVETIDVSDCDSIEEIVEIPANSAKVEFLKLHSLTLESLSPSFTSFCSREEKDMVPPLFDILNVYVLLQVKISNLDSLNLSSINIQKIWCDQSLSSFCFQNLIKLVVKDCNKLRYLCSLSVASGLRMLKNLYVSECHAMEKIFCTEGNGVHKVFVFPKLEEIHLSKMKMLTDIWQTKMSVDSFCSLISVHIEECEKLDKIFPSHMEGWYASLEKLKVVNLSSCTRMVEIIACEDGLENEPLVFPELTNMKLYFLKNMERFYKGRHGIKCPKMNKLIVVKCGKLETFQIKRSESTNEEVAVFSTPKELFPNLEFLNIDVDQAEKWLLSNIKMYRMHRLKQLFISGEVSFDSLYQFLYRMPNLEKLSLWLDKLMSSANIAAQERLGTVLQLKELVLSYSFTEDIGLERHPFLRRLELLTLQGCDNLSILAPPWVSLTYLTYLEVKSCHGLRNLMASSMAKSLVQLKTIKVIDCNEIKEIIISYEGNEKENIEIVFSNLITIELVTLKQLTSFCSNKNCKFKFPLLEILIVRECPKMETFSENLASAPKLQNILAVEGEEEAKWQWERNLNGTIQNVFNDKVSFRYSEHLDLSSYPEFIEQLWHRNHLDIQNNFGNLKSLDVYECDSLEYVIPSHLLPCFENLEEIWVWNCREARVIFNISDETKALGIIRLKRLSLDDLPKLEHVWDKDPEGIIDLQVLRYMHVERCDSLKSLFPAGVAKKDVTCRLEMLEVTKCRELVEIFSKGAESEGATKMFVFSSLTSLTLTQLPKLKYFYPGLHTLECEDDAEEQVLIEIEKVIQTPSLKKVSFSIGHIQVTWDRESAGGQLQFDKLKDFKELLDSAPLYRFLHKLPNIQKLAFNRCWFEEMFSAERPNADYTPILLHLKVLELSHTKELKSIGLEHSWLQPFLENLQTLQVNNCWNLSNLVPSPCTVSFPNLTYLKVGNCYELVYLFTSSTAKSLGRLRRLKIEKCKSLIEIVSSEGNESDEDEQIIFEQLQVLYLKELGVLRWFYPGNYTLRFPCLEQVHVIDCRWMKTFSPNNIINHSTTTKWFSAEYGTSQQCDNHNSTAHRILFEEKVRESRYEDDIGLENSWIQPILPNITVLKIYRCNSLRCLFTSSTAKSLTQLKTMEIERCDSIEEIIVCNKERDESNEDEIIFPKLKSLNLEELSKLKSFYRGSLSLPSLDQLKVSSCSTLEYLFTSSTAKSLAQLKIMEISWCDSIEEIVVCNKEGDESNEDEIIFPNLNSLNLEWLPELKNFYRGSLSLPSLDQLKVIDCTRMISFCAGTVKADKLSQVQFDWDEDPIPVKNDLNSTMREVFLAKITPDLEHLTLDANELKMISQGEFLGNLLPKLKVLALLFHIKSDEFVQHMPNVEKLEVHDGSFKEIFCLAELKELRLKSLEEIVPIGLESSWIESFVKNIESFGVISCFSSTSLVPCTVSFSNLTHLELNQCNGLLHLFTSSTAKNLTQLKTMEIAHCYSIEEIVVCNKEGDESNEDEIIFLKLNSLNLERLSKLKSFYRGSLSFPSLDQLKVIDCTRMKTFCAGTVKADKLSQVQFDLCEYPIPVKNDLNSTMRKWKAY
uniref:Disease resistance protein At4g27220 n=1 Tax=Cajanus cajan TaxID=3821 RepID=A0A151UCW8_CAJCA|nr:putative disease resistance protein At4g27220 [Cajanus cajan]